MSMSMSSSSSAESVNFPPSDHFSTSEQLCYVHCNFCDTVLAVSVPCSSLFKTVTVRCGHCTNLISVNMRALLFPPTSQLHLGHSFFNPPNLLEGFRNAPLSMNMLVNHPAVSSDSNESSITLIGGGGTGFVQQEIPKPPPVNRPPEKRQRVPSAYNRFIKDEIQRIKAGNPDISHREAFSAAAKNWAHFPHIHFGLMPDHQPGKKASFRQQQEGEDVMLKEGVYASAGNIGVTPY